MKRPYDLLVIGSGSAGFNAARTAASLGKRVAIVDGAKQLGGLCILKGCMPSTAISASSRTASANMRQPNYTNSALVCACRLAWRLRGSIR